GDPTHPADLEMVRLEEAEMLIILADQVGGDSRAIRTLIAADSSLRGFETVPAVVEVHDTATAAHLARVYPTGVHTLVPSLAIGRIAAIALREAGLGQVATSLLDDQGSDIHISEIPPPVGTRFSDIRDDYPTARPLGILRAGGDVELNPAAEARFEEGDRMILISDRGGGLVGSGHVVDSTVAADHEDIALDFDRPDQHLLVVGWSELAALMLADWASVTAPTSTAEVLIDPKTVAGDEIVTPDGPVFEVTTSSGVPDLAERLAGSPRIDTILICANVAGVEETDVDSRTLLDLVAIRRTLKGLTDPMPRVLVELLDVDSVPLADMPNPDDFVVSEALVSQLIAQLAEQPDRRRVLLQLYDHSGPSIHLVSPERLGLLGLHKAREVFEAAYRAGVLAIGWRLSGARGGQVVINPGRDQEEGFDEDDRIAVIG
ncbi:MAG: hypothetical protein WAL25_14775, partial [Acidimicrobiia bacterium]